ncbi:MAG: MCE family protein [Bacteroidales bacterium]|nr:MCE family protein [Bacteroidales bacterium]
MQPKKSYNLLLGIFIFFGIVIFALAIYLVGKKQNLFTSNVKVMAIFTDVSGLTVGNNVRFSGIDVGTVSNIRILSENEVRVELSIQSSVMPFIRKNSVATIGSEGLMGNKTVTIIPGTMEKRMLTGGDTLTTIQPVNIDEILIEIQKSSENIAVVSQNLIDITDRIKVGEGVFGKIFTDTSLTVSLDKASRNVVMITSNLNKISERVSQGEGILGKLLADTAISVNLGEASSNLIFITENLEGITDKINRGEGIFGKLFTDTTLAQNLYQAGQHINESSEELEIITRNLNEITEKINSGKGLINKLIADSAFADSVDMAVIRLNRGIVSVTEASETIKRSRMIRLFSKKKKRPEDNKSK